MRFNLAVKGIIRKGDKILVLKRSVADDHKPGAWETVGGGMDDQSSPQEALKREIKEETDLEVEVNEPFNVFTFTKDTGEFKIGITFACTYVSGEVNLSGEHSEYKWIKPEEFNKLDSISSLYDEIEEYAQKYGNEE